MSVPRGTRLSFLRFSAGALRCLLACLAVDPIIDLIFFFMEQVFAECSLLSWVSSVVKIRVSFVG